MYPVAYSARYEAEDRNRLTVFFRLILAIPWAIWASIWSIAVTFSVIAAWFALLFTGRYPEALYSFNSNFLRFVTRFNAWEHLLTDEWPPFDGSPDDSYPIRLNVAPPLAEYSRVKVLFRIILLIPVAILAWVMSIVLRVIAFLAWFALVFVARLPEGFYRPLRAATAYLAKAGAYYMLLTEDWPEFWVDEQEEASAFGAAPPPPSPPPPPAPPAAPAA